MSAAVCGVAPRLFWRSSDREAHLSVKGSLCARGWEASRVLAGCGATGPHKWVMPRAGFA